VDRAVVDLGIGGRVDLVGAQHDPASWLAAMDVFALSSRWEGLPRAALEAAASGLPIVSTRCGGMAELAARGAAVLCDVNDADALAALVEEAIEARPASRDAPAWIHEFSATEMVDKTALLYDELVPARLTV